MVRLTALSNGQNQPVIRLGKKGQPCRQLNPETVVAKWAQSLTPRAGMIAYLPCKQPTQKWLCYTGPIAYPKSWYDRLLRPKSGTITPIARSPTPRAVRSTTTPNKRRYLQKQLGRLPQERYDQLLRPEKSTSTPTTRLPTPRVVRSNTSPKERHNQQKQLGRLLQEQYNRPLHPKKWHK